SKNTRSFEETFDWYLQGNRASWYLGDTIPRLDDVRGKIVLLRRFKRNVPNGADPSKLSPLGIDATPWADDATFDVNHAAHRKVQDDYEATTLADRDDKWQHVKKALQERLKAPIPNCWYFNFASGSSKRGLDNPDAVADYVNHRLRDELSTAGPGCVGT